MDRLLETKRSTIDMALTAIFGWLLTARELELRVQAIAGHFKERSPEEKTPSCFLHWLPAPLPELKTVVLREFLRCTERVFPRIDDCS
jgi:hypothetical protein